MYPLKGILLNNQSEIRNGICHCGQVLLEAIWAGAPVSYDFLAIIDALLFEDCLPTFLDIWELRVINQECLVSRLPVMQERTKRKTAATEYDGYNGYNGGWPSARLFGWSAADWSRPATDKSISSGRTRKKSIVLLRKATEYNSPLQLSREATPYALYFMHFILCSLL